MSTSVDHVPGAGVATGISALVATGRSTSAVLDTMNAVTMPTS